MTKKITGITPLPADLVPSKPTSRTIAEAVDHAKARGIPQKTIAAMLDVAANNPSMWKSGAAKLALPRVMTFAAATGMSDRERSVFLLDRLIELHGEEGQFDLQAILQFAYDYMSPTEDEARLLDWWRGIRGDAQSDPTNALGGLLEDPAVRARFKKLMLEVVNDYLGGLRAA